MKLKGIELTGTYPVKFKNTWFEVYNEYGNVIYHEHINNDWVKLEYDEKGNVIYQENNKGDWAKWEYDEKGNMIYYETKQGFWAKRDYDEKGNEIYYEDSVGCITDKRVKELTVEEIEKLLGYKIKIKGESK